MNENEKFMKLALEEAGKAFQENEVPVGAIIVKNNKVISAAHNQREYSKQVNGHAEMEAISLANKALSSWRLDDCEMYVTMEPCIMCAGAIMQAHIKTVYIGVIDEKGGAFGGSIDVRDALNVNFKPMIKSGIFKEECSSLIKDFFKKQRSKK